MNPRSITILLIQKFPGWTFLTVLLAVLSAALNGITTTVIGPFVLSILGTQLNLQNAPPILKRLSIGLAESNQNYLLLATVFIGLIAAKNTILFLSNVASKQLSRLCAEELRGLALSKILSSDMNFVGSTKPGDLFTYVGSGVDETRNLILDCCLSIPLALSLLTYIAILFWLSPALTALSIVLFSMVFLLNQALVTQTRRLAERRVVLTRNRTSEMFQLFSGLRLIMENSTAAEEKQRHLTGYKVIEQVDYRANLIGHAVMPITEITGYSALIAVIILQRAMAPEPSASLPVALVAFLLVLFRSLPYLSQINSKRANFARYIPKAEALLEFLNKPVSSLIDGSVQYRKLKNGITFENVTFSYANLEHRAVLQNISFQIPKGSSLALVGTSGAGKSTIADLLCRFYDPQQGEIRLDDCNLKEFDLHSLRKNIGIVSQDCFLFNNTIAFNIEYANPSASMDEVIMAAKCSHAWDFICKLPDGLNTLVGDRGIALSGGERQRIAIARAILKNPDILILDEATSALDAISEQIVQEAMEDLMKNRTTLIIAHRLSTVRRAGRIAVIDHGSIVELGTHEELLAKDGYYRQMSNAFLDQT